MKHKFLNWGLIIIAVFLAVSLFRNIQNMQASNEKINEAKNRVAKMKDQNEELQKKLNTVQKVDFVEAEARDKLGLAKPGEIVVILPDEATVRLFAPPHEEEENFIPDPNWKKWLKLFL